MIQNTTRSVVSFYWQGVVVVYNLRLYFAELLVFQQDTTLRVVNWFCRVFKLGYNRRLYLLKFDVLNPFRIVDSISVGMDGFSQNTTLRVVSLSLWLFLSVSFFGVRSTLFFLFFLYWLRCYTLHYSFRVQHKVLHSVNYLVQAQ